MASTRYRADIQGLRALAVLLVVAGHLFPTVIKGGFIGVDIFFVISGFVITQQMISMHESHKKNFLLTFYSRRIRRILPSALFVTLGTVWATGYFLGPVAANETYRDGAWSSIFLGNFHFQNTVMDYFSAGTQISPSQHFWSLSIEEQFYLVWPTIFMLLFAIPLSKVFKQIAIGSVVAFSFFYAMYETQVNDSVIFFSTSTRIWELGVGALIAMNYKSLAFPIRFIAPSLVLALVASTFVITQSMQWPRFTALPIIVITALLLLRDPSTQKFSLLENRVATYIGDLSYIIYLWHWPILIIVKARAGELGVKEILTVLILTALLSIATHHGFENPIRHSTRLISTPVLTVTTGIAAIAVCATTLFSRYQG